MARTPDGNSGERIFSRLPDIVPRHIAGDTILVPVRGELARVQQLFVLDEVGEFIWNQIDGVRSTQALISLVLQSYDVDEGTAQEDTLEFLTDLEDAGLVVARLESPPPDQ